MSSDDNIPNAQRPFGAVIEIWSEDIAQVPSGFADSVMSALALSDNTDGLMGHAMSVWSDSLSDGHTMGELDGSARVDSVVAQSIYADAVEQSDTALTSALHIWSQDGVAEIPDGFAEKIARAAGLQSVEVPVIQQVEHKSAPVIRPKRWLVPIAASSMLAIAAVAVFAVANARRPKPPVVNHHIALTHQTPITTTPNLARPLPEVATQEPAPRLVASIQSSSVDKVNVDGDRTQYTVLALPGEDEGTTVAVVWIEDGAKRQM